MNDYKLSVIIRMHEKKCLGFLDELLFLLSSNKISDQIMLVYCLHNIDEEEYIARLSDTYKLPHKFIKIYREKDIRSLLMKEAILSCDTEYLTFLDYDDFPSLLGYFESIRLLDSDPQLTATFGKILSFDCSWNEGNRYIYGKKSTYYTPNKFEYYFHNPFPLHASVIRVKDRKQELANFVNVDLERLEDYWFFLNIISSFKIKILPENILMGIYFIYRESSINTNIDSSWEKARAILNLKLKDLRVKYISSYRLDEAVTYRNYRKFYRRAKRVLAQTSWKDINILIRLKLFLYYLSSLTIWSLYARFIKK